MDAPILLLKNSSGVKVPCDFFMLEESIVKIGRDSTADLRIPDPFVSRLQAEIYFEHEKWFIRDVQSKNGTFVNDVKIGAEPVQLNHGDTISFCKKYDFLYQEKNLDSNETKSMALPTAPYGIIMVEETEDVIVDGITINPRLGPREWEFLSILMSDPDRIHDYKEFGVKMCGEKEDIFVLDPVKKQMQIIKNDITKKFRKQGITREIIKSRSNVGYLLVKRDQVDTQDRRDENVGS